MVNDKKLLKELLKLEYINVNNQEIKAFHNGLNITISKSILHDILHIQIIDKHKRFKYEFKAFDSTLNIFKTLSLKELIYSRLNPIKEKD